MTLDELRTLDGAKLRYALMDLAKTIPDAIALGRGDPDLATPDHVVAAAKVALARDVQPLQPVAGMPALRAAIAKRARTDHGLDVGAEQVLVTTGGQEGLFLVMSALLDPGDEILVPDPRYTSYDQAIEHAGGVSVTVPTHPEDAFDLRAEAIEALVTPKTKALLLVTPSNPTGGIISREQAEKIAALAKKHDFVVISDEIYGKFVWPPFEHVSIGSLPGMERHTITLSGFSKAWAMTGWRVGYVIAEQNAIDGMAAIKMATTGPVANVSQAAALAAAEADDACIDAFKVIYGERRDLLARGLTDMGLEYTDPRGGFFFWAKSSSTGLRSLELSYLLLKEARVLVFPGTGFGERWSDYLRITTLQPTDVLREAVERMTPVVKRYAAEAAAHA